MDNELRLIALRAYCRICPDGECCEYILSRSKCERYKTFSANLTIEYSLYNLDKHLFKTCSKCGKKKSINEFYTNGHTPDGKVSICKECDGSYHKELYAKRKDLCKSTEKNPLPETSMQAARIRVMKDYYDPEKKYLLKKYLKRHQQQLSEWVAREDILKKQIASCESNSMKKHFSNLLKTAKDKIEKLKEKIEIETEMLTPKTR